MLPQSKNMIVLEDASLELVPKKLRNHNSCRLVEQRFSVLPSMQILDDNYHHDLIVKLPDPVKRGRPDVVHFALLDITSTPLYMTSQVAVVIHTVNDETITLEEKVRLPRTPERFCGVMSKVLSGTSGEAERKLFNFQPDQSFDVLMEKLAPDSLVCLTKEGIEKDVKGIVGEMLHREDPKRIAWIVGGFPRGHFDEDVKSVADKVVSISSYSLSAHVVTARLCYELELSQ